MPTDEIVQLTPEAVREIVEERKKRETGFKSFGAKERRRQPRWPFPSTAEIAPVDGDTTIRWFATCHDLSQSGLGMTCDRYFEPDTPLEIGIHLPEATLFGRAVVRYCMQTPRGYMTGVEFIF
jgi:hypothetical protein